jgi:glutaminyl-peptide cyclotransferase
MGSTNKPRQRRKPKETTSDGMTTTRPTSRVSREDGAASVAARDDPPMQRRKRSLVAFASVVIIGSVVLLLAVLVPPNKSSGSNSSSSTKPTTTNNNSGTNDTQTQPSPLHTVFGTYELLETVQHDSTAFTQGLVTVEVSTDHATINNEATTSRSSTLQFYEGTGIHGSSELRLLDMSTGTVLAKHKLPNAYFGEGIAHYRDKNNTLRLIQLTWKEQIAFEYILLPQQYAANSTTTIILDEPIANWTYTTTTKEGWGVTYSAATNQFYVTDGSHYLHVWDATTRQQVRKVAVTYQTTTADNNDIPIEIPHLNELEWDPATNTVLANVWYQNILIRIDPVTGFVPVIYDLTTLFPTHTRPAGTDTLNGIALTYDSSLANNNATSAGDADQVWVTGKYWPSMYRIRLIDS